MQQRSTKLQGLMGIISIAILFNVFLFAYYKHSGTVPSYLFSALPTQLEQYIKIFSTEIYNHIIAKDDIGIASLLAFVSISNLLIAYLIYIPMHYIFNNYIFSESSNKIINIEDNGNLSFYIPEICVVIKRPYKKKNGDQKKIIFKDVRHPFKETAIRLERADVRLSRDSKSDVENLETALLAILYKHKYWTSDPNNYHADINLYDHSVEVAKKVIELSKSNRLARVVGLAHDIGKLIAYKPIKTVRDEEGNIISVSEWKKVSHQHDKSSAHIVRMLPEFKALKESDRVIINTVLSYSHKPTRLPKHATNKNVISLLKALRLADGLTAKEDKDKQIDLLANDALIEELGQYIVRVFPVLNINMIREGYADGWTIGLLPYIAVKESAIREKLKGMMPLVMEDQLRLKAAIKPHPATAVIVASLERMGYLMTKHNHYEPKDRLFTVKSGKTEFKKIILLKKNAVENEIGDLIDDWGDNKYPLKVIHPKAVDNQT